MSEQQEFRHSFIAEGTSRSAMKTIEAPILAYRGDLLDPEWMDEERGKT